MSTAGAIEDATTRSNATGSCIFDPSRARPSADFLARIDREFARRHLVLSAGTRNDIEDLLVAPGIKPTVLYNISVRLGRATCAHECAPETIAAAIDRIYAQNIGTTEPEAAFVVEGTENLPEGFDAAVRDTERDLLSTHGKAPSVRLVDLILFEALSRGASDVHLQPLRDRTLIRFRLNGTLHTMRELPAAAAASVTSRIKVMGGLDVSERRTPQDGRASVLIGGKSGKPGSLSSGRQADLRISTMPSIFGERVVLRLLDPSRSPHLSSFSALGMPDLVERAYLSQISRTSGIVLSTGPTGSGKTTTLYASLAWVSATNAGGSLQGCELNIVTVEDPVEYDLSGGGLAISQTQVDPKKQVSFATGLRHILRQDPDVIMVGEIRDEETARIAVQASLTGHLVLSTLHTGDSSSAVARLLDLGVEPFLVSSSLNAVLAQRLVRRVQGSVVGLDANRAWRQASKGAPGSSSCW